MWPTNTDMRSMITSTKSVHTMIVVMPPQGSKVLLISISTFSALVILLMTLVILCLIVALNHIMHKSPAMYTSQNIYAELEPGSIHETPNQFEDKGDILGAYERISLSSSDGSNVSPPVYANATL